MAPLKIRWFNQVRDSIQQSFSYFFLAEKILAKAPVVEKTVTAFSILENPDLMQRLSSTSEFRNFFLNEKVQSLLADEAFMESVRERNIPKLLSNPKILEIFQDDHLMENFGRLAARIYSLDYLPTITDSATE